MKPYISALGMFLLVAVAYAQTPPTEEEAQKNMAAQAKDPLATQGSGGEDWSMVKGHEKGYLTAKDAPANSWLALNFKSCDKDRDGKITEAEYTKCQKAL